MQRLIVFLRSRAGSLLLFHLGMLLFSWPMLSITANRGGVPFFLYLFLAWAGLIVLLAFMAFATRNDPSERDGE